MATTTAASTAGALLLGALLACLPVHAAVAQGDGQHDFDFNLGTWKTHIHRVSHPPGAQPASVEITGTVTVRPIWGGRAQLEEIEADGPQGHWQGATLFLYNPKARQWTQTYFDSANPVPSTTTGGFADGRGELYSQDIVDGKAILVRGTWSDIRPDSHRYEEAWSHDGGRTWETMFSAQLERIAQ